MEAGAILVATNKLAIIEQCDKRTRAEREICSWLGGAQFTYLIFGEDNSLNPCRNLGHSSVNLCNTNHGLPWRTTLIAVLDHHWSCE